MSKLTGLEEKLGVRKKTREEAFGSFIPRERGFMQDNPGGSVPQSFDMMGDADSRASAASPQIVTSEERIARAISESTTTEKVEMTVRAEPGTSAEITKKPSGSGRTKLDMPASGRPR
jgi:hypothetical protein